MLQHSWVKTQLAQLSEDSPGAPCLSIRWDLRVSQELMLQGATGSWFVRGFRFMHGTGGHLDEALEAQRVVRCGGPIFWLS